MSGFCAVPRMNGFSGDSARARCSWSSVGGTIARNTSSLRRSRVLSSWLVRNPSKKCTKGIRVCIVDTWEMRAMSWASCTDADDSRATPV